jgi:hypothetical protein
LKPLDTVAAFISFTGGVHMLQGTSLVPPMHVITVVDTLCDALRLEKEDGLEDRVEATPWVWGRTARAPRNAVYGRPPELRNTDGEMVVFAEAHFDVLDEPALRQALDAADGLDKDQDKWLWGRPVDERTRHLWECRPGGLDADAGSELAHAPDPRQDDARGARGWCDSPPP